MIKGGAIISNKQNFEKKGFLDGFNASENQNYRKIQTENKTHEDTNVKLSSLQVIQNLQFPLNDLTAKKLTNQNHFFPRKVSISKRLFSTRTNTRQTSFTIWLWLAARQWPLSVFVYSRHLQHVGTCEVQREMHQVANSGQRTANLTTFLRVAISKKKK